MTMLHDGYVVDVPYPTFVHRQAMPLWLSTLAKCQGDVAPDTTRPFRYLELGCAMGIHLHLTAAAHPNGHFVGVDVNAQHLAVAQEGLERTGIANIEFIEASFQALLTADLEPFDFIVTHGVWSWIADEHKLAITQLVERLLKPQGLFYCSYMSHPGATSMSSIQKLMFEMSRNLNGDSATKALQGIHLARKIGQTQAGLFARIPSLNQDLEQLAQDKPNYIAHDYLSAHWEPQHAADMLRHFGNIGLSFCGGAGILENIDRVSLSPDIVKIVKQLPLVTLQETVKDIARNTLQRQDVYTRDRIRLNAEQLASFYQQQKFAVLPDAPIGKSLKDDEKVGKIYDAIALFERILILLNEQAMSLAQLHVKLNLNVTKSQLKEVVLVLVWAGYIHPSQDATHADVGKMNAWMFEQQLPWRTLAQFGTAIELKN